MCCEVSGTLEVVTSWWFSLWHFFFSECQDTQLPYTARELQPTPAKFLKKTKSAPTEYSATQLQHPARANSQQYPLFSVVANFFIFLIRRGLAGVRARRIMQLCILRCIQWVLIKGGCERPFNVSPPVCARPGKFFFLASF